MTVARRLRRGQSVRRNPTTKPMLSRADPCSSAPTPTRSRGGLRVVATDLHSLACLDLMVASRYTASEFKSKSEARRRWLLVRLPRLPQFFLVFRPYQAPLPCRRPRF